MPEIHASSQPTRSQTCVPRYEGTLMRVYEALEAV